MEHERWSPEGAAQSDLPLRVGFESEALLVFQLQRLTDAHGLIELAFAAVERAVKAHELGPGVLGHLRIGRVHLDAVCGQIPPAIVLREATAAAVRSAQQPTEEIR